MAGVWDLWVAPYAEGLGITVAAALTLMVYSFLLGDNVLYRLAEHIFVGVAVGYSAVVAFHSVLYPKLLAPLLASPQENLLLLVPLALCLMLLAHAVPRIRALSTVPLALVIGVGAALSVGGAITGIIVPQVQATLLPLDPQQPPARLINNLIIITATVTTLMYFYFTAGSRSAPARAVRAVGAVGKWFMMIGFGAYFGNVVMSRISLLIGRVQFLLGDWLHLIR